VGGDGDTSVGAVVNYIVEVELHGWVRRECISTAAGSGYFKTSLLKHQGCITTESVLYQGWL